MSTAHTRVLANDIIGDLSVIRPWGCPSCTSTGLMVISERRGAGHLTAQPEPAPDPVDRVGGLLIAVEDSDIQGSPAALGGGVAAVVGAGVG